MNGVNSFLVSNLVFSSRCIVLFIVSLRDGRDPVLVKASRKLDAEVEVDSTSRESAVEELTKAAPKKPIVDDRYRYF